MNRLADHLPDILRRRAKGQSYREIAAFYGVVTGYVYQVAPAGNDRNKPHEKSLIREARKLWNRDLTARDIAEALSTTERPLTRNAIIGISHRNGFRYRRPPT